MLESRGYEVGFVRHVDPITTNREAIVIQSGATGVKDPSEQLVYKRCPREVNESIDSSTWHTTYRSKRTFRIFFSDEINTGHDQVGHIILKYHHFLERFAGISEHRSMMQVCERSVCEIRVLLYTPSPVYTTFTHLLERKPIYA